MRKPRGTTVVMAIAVLCACGGDDGISASDYAEAIEDANCDWLMECGFIKERAACTDSWFSTTGLETLVGGTKDGTVSYDESAAAACADEVRDADCNFTGLRSGLDGECQDVFEGKVAVGGSCYFSDECEGEAACLLIDNNCEMACCPGTCTAWPVLADGQPCDGSIPGRCGNASYCGGTPLICRALVGEGQPCEDFGACQDPMLCNIFVASPVCLRPVATGETCRLDALLPCIDYRDACDPATLKCVRSPAIGEACIPDGIPCQGFAYCSANVCTQNPGAGGACNSDVRCLQDLECIGGVCTAPMAPIDCSG
jgi:hypothetical protein